MNHAVLDTGSTLRPAPEGPVFTPPAPWNELVTAALLGTVRRTPPGGTTDALLDAAAVETVRQRAGLRPAPAGPLPEPAPKDGRPPLPTAAEARLRMLLAGRTGSEGQRGQLTAALGGGRRGSSPDVAELLPQWLAVAVQHGYRAPAELVPALLGAARARTDLRRDALAFTGRLGIWLARLNPDWKFALRGTGAAPHEEREAADRESDRRIWEEGLFAERMAVLAARRRRSPAAGRALLASTWETERAEDRLMFVDSLRDGLSDGDEPFLEKALSDRSRTVRETAAELLSALPGSALANRMAGRALGCVALDEAPSGPRIVVEPPYMCDAGMQRDGIPVKPPSGRGERAWWLSRLVEAAPLAVWSSHFGDRGPAEITALPVAGSWDPDLHGSWCRAAIRQQDAEWARALIGPPGGAPADGPKDPARLLAVLPPEERALWAAEFVAAHGLSDAFRILGVCAVPWSDPLGRSFVDALQIARDAGSYPWSFSGVMGLAERCLAPSGADRLEPLAALPDETQDSSPGAGAYWSEAFQRLVATLRLREAIHAELRGGATDTATR